MASTNIGAVIEYFRREFDSRARKDLVLDFETGPATNAEIAQVRDELQQEFPTIAYMLVTGDPGDWWKVSAWVRSDGRADVLRKELGQWASEHEPFLRTYSVRQRSLWRTA
jgi:hypothetical protein